MATLTVTPNPAPPSTDVNVAGRAFPTRTRLRLKLDGVITPNTGFKANKSGNFSVGVTVGSTEKTQILVAEQYTMSTWKEVARTSIVVQAVVTPPPPVDPPPTPPPSTPNIVSFSGSAASFATLVADLTVDVIEIAAGTYTGWSVALNANRSTKPLLIRPASGATVTWDGTGVGGAHLFSFGFSSLTTDITFDPTGTNGSFNITNYSINNTGIMLTGDILRLTLNRFKVRSCTGDASGNTSHCLLISSALSQRGKTITANYWDIVGTDKTLNGLATFNAPNADGITATGWTVNGLNRALYLGVDPTGIAINTWNVTSCNYVVDAQGTAQGTITNTTATSMTNTPVYGQSPWTDLAFTNGTGNSWGNVVVTPPPTTPPPTGVYPPETTLKVITLPSVPALPAKYVQTSTPFGTKVVRIGDTGQRHSYSKIQPWNADESLLFFAYSGRLLNGTTYALISTAIGNPGNFNWHPTNPHLGYSTQGGDSNLYVHDVSNPSSPSRSILHNFGRSISLGYGEGGIADDGTVALLDDSGNVSTWNVNSNTGTGFFSIGGHPDSATMSRNGQIVVGVFERTSTGHTGEIWAYNKDGSNAHFVRSGSQHGDTAVSVAGRQVWIQADGMMHDLITGAATSLFPFQQAGRAGHVSGRGQPGWGYYSVYDTTQTGIAGNDQLYAVKLDGSGTVRVYGFANRRGTSYETQPQAVPNRNGTRYMFASDWGNLGTYCFVAGMNP